MKISIIMPCFNAQATIKDSINSILNQTYTNWELIIYDDASSDNTRLILDHYLRVDSRIRVNYNNINLGPGVCRNRAIKQSNGNYITFLDSDDLWHKNKLLVQLNFMIEKKIDFSHHAYKYFFFNDLDNKSYSNKVFKSNTLDKFKYLSKRGFGYCNTFMFSENIKNTIIFNESSDVCEDFEAFLDFFCQGGKSYGIDDVLGFIRLSTTSRSSNKKKVIIHMLNFYLFKLKGNSILNLIYFFLYLYDSFMNKYRINIKLMFKNH